MFDRFSFFSACLVSIMYIASTNANGLCSCACCTGIDCKPIPVGKLTVPTCDDFTCYKACKENFKSICASPSTGQVSVTCEQYSTTTSPTASTTTLWNTTMTSTLSPTTTTMTTITTSTSTPSEEGLCQCSCCDGFGCKPVDAGSLIVPTCTGLTCYTGCRKMFPRICASSTTSEVIPTCKVIPITTKLPTTTARSTSTKPANTTTSLSTATVSTTAGNITVTISTGSSGQTTTVTSAHSSTSVPLTTKPSGASLDRQTSTLAVLLIVSIILAIKIDV
jgi:hypothetical protein